MRELFEDKLDFGDAISPFIEMAAYEAIWQRKETSFSRIANYFKKNPFLKPSDMVGEEELSGNLELARKIINELSQSDVPFGIRVHGEPNYPEKLRDAKNPVEVLYYQGNWNLIHSPSIAIVGARKVTDEGLKRTRKITRLLVEAGYTIVSGLAEGVDTMAHQTAIKVGGRTIAVIGTPLTQVYPKSNTELQSKIAKDYLVISQVPFARYSQQDFRINRSFFPQRNITMSALTEATIIVEASDTSGTLYQARAAIAQGRKLFILDSCFKNHEISWPDQYLKKGAIRVKEFSDIIENLE
ncbi:DNA-processing protein DprA [Aliidiomarina halalkaliphila]|uniref:DNA-processing protein DprA n=1 Tax=Aliidiomarina halalkaliphila TaxID=2593535 RepID=A0A552X202_9GAMM|nr:DNA-processing protein DprA [Aliidiomarina halalkaliphila]TRW48909.1 DNA-processing protein DprA [Aliidiomarina halalkaliphila]